MTQNETHLQELRRLEAEAFQAWKTSKDVYSAIDAKKLYDKLRIQRLKVESAIALGVQRI